MADDSFTLLLVDDDAGILSALRRLFRELDDTEVFTAESAEAGAQVLKSYPIDLLISDERMPGIQGHKFIQFVKKYYPDTVRIVLTGYSDFEAMKTAVNSGEVYRYLFKPWDDDDLLVTVKNALHHSRSERERTSLVEELARVNRELEAQVAKRTAELQKAIAVIRAKQQQTESTLEHTIVFLSSLTALIDKESARRSLLQRTASLAEQLAKMCVLPPEEERLVKMACHALAIGAIAAGESGDAYIDREGRLKTTIVETAGDLVESVLGFPALAEVIRRVPENVDGSGSPDGLMLDAIPIASRIVRFSLAYNMLSQGEEKKTSQAFARIRGASGTIYDPQIIAYADSILAVPVDNATRTIRVRDLLPGMTLVEDLVLDNGIVFVAGNAVLTTKTVERIGTRIADPSFPLDAEREVRIYTGKEGGRHG